MKKYNYNQRYKEGYTIVSTWWAIATISGIVFGSCAKSILLGISIFFVIVSWIVLINLMAIFEQLRYIQNIIMEAKDDRKKSTN